MKLRLVQRKNPLRPMEPQKWYANTVKSGDFTIDDFTEVLARSTALTRGDIKNTISAFTDEIPTFLKVGQSVHLGEFGTFRLTAISEGATTKKEFQTNKVKVRIVFTPSVALKRALEKISLEVEKEKEEETTNP